MDDGPRAAHTLLVAVGVLSVVLGLITRPYLLGFVAIVSGITVYWRYDRWHGTGLAVLGIVVIIVGLATVTLSLSPQ